MLQDDVIMKDLFTLKNRLPQKQTILESKQENCIEIAFFAYGQKSRFMSSTLHTRVVPFL